MESDLQRSSERFEADPNDTAAFDALETALYQGGMWNELVRLYERRLESPELGEQPKQRASLLFRLGQVLEERCLHVDRALECYQDVARFDAAFRPALTQLRRIYVAREQWDLALQVAELEGALPLSAWEQADFSAQMGEIWHRRLGDASQALDHFEHALAADPDHQDALLGVARVHEELGHPEAAVTALERALTRMAGPDRAGALVALARLYAGPLGDTERATEIHRRALTEDPRNQEALEALVESASEREQWELVAELNERRFGLAAGAMRRLAIAHEAARVWLDQLRNPQGARLWLRRALELFPDDPATHFALADVERLSGNLPALAEHLSRGVALAGVAAPEEALRELASLAPDHLEPQAALDPLRRLLEQHPADEDVVRQLAGVLERLGRDEELVEILERQVSLAAEATPERASLLCQLAVLQEERLDDPAAAIASYEQAMNAHADPRAEEALERLYRKAEDWDRLRALLERTPTDPERAAERHCALGELRIEHFSDEEGARRAFEAAQNEDPCSTRAQRGLDRIAVSSGDEEGILESFEREAATTTDRSRLAFLVWELVRIHETRGEQDESLHWIERLVAAAPEDVKALETRARLQEELGLSEEFVESLDRLDLLLHGGDQAANRRRIAALHVEHGDTERAIESYQRAVSADPRDRLSLDALAGLLEANGRYPELAEVERQRAESGTEEERRNSLSRLAALLEGPLGDPDSAIAVLNTLAGDDGLPDEDAATLEGLLEERERFEELEEHLARRRGKLDDGSDEARSVDLRRAELLHHRLGRAGDAAELLRGVQTRGDDSDDTRDALELALRDAGNAEGLVALLISRANAQPDRTARARLDLERATLLESPIGEIDEARELFESIAEAGTPVAREAGVRLETLLERTRDWEALRERLERRVSRDAEPGALHEQLAALCRDRLRDPAAAIEHLEAAAGLAPERVELWQALARLYEEEDRPQDLLSALEREIHTEPPPDRELLLRARAAALCDDALDDPEAATRHFVRVLELDPSHPIAAEFVVDRLDRDGRHEDLAEILAQRLAHLEASENTQSTQRETATALRLRLAALRAGPLDDGEGAVALLEPVAADDAALLVVAEPLADLYERSGRHAEAVALCRRAIQVSDHAPERGGWCLRLGDGLRATGDDAAAAEAYRQCLADRPDTREARDALREIYRRLGEHDALARLLEAELARLGGAEEIPVRLELAEILAGDLSRPEDALLHLLRIVELDPQHRTACERGRPIAKQLARHDDRLALLGHALRQGGGRGQRAALLFERAELLAGPLARPREAVDVYREALAADPGRGERRRELLGVLESLARWPEVLECLADEAHHLPAEERPAVFDEAARVAEAHLDAGAALPWLERLRVARPEDSEVLARIAALHRGADRWDALVRALEAEIALEPEAPRRFALERERAEIYETRLGLPGRAIEALEQARLADPRAREVLNDLARLQAATGRPREHARSLEALCAGTTGASRIALCRELAELHVEALADPATGARHLWTALAECSGGVQRIELLRHLAHALLEAGRCDLWARATEAELALLDPTEPVFRERRLELHRALAASYDTALGAPHRALEHWRNLLDGLGSEGMHSDPLLHEEAERRVIDSLRASGAHVELERRLRARLEHRPECAEEWLELGRLRAERLHQPAAAAEAFRRVLALDPRCLPALRGLRHETERLGDWNEVARTLESELELPDDRSAAARSALYRRLGEIAWRELDSTTRASRAFAAALEADASDLVALRSLESLFETMEDWRGALDLYQSEIEILGDGEPERRFTVWLRIGELARDRFEDPERALGAFEAAAELGELDLDRRAQWAELYAANDLPERFAEVFGAWCDDPESGADAATHLRLARSLEEIGRLDAALERAESAARTEPEHGGAWDEVVRLREAGGDTSGCAEALERAASCHRGTEAARRLRRAAELIEERDVERAAALLEQATGEDPADAASFAQLARVCERLGRFGRAQNAAERVLELASPGDGVDVEQGLAAALAGARAARERGQLDAAERLFAAARSVAPDHPEALAGHGDVLHARGEHAAARQALEARLALEAPDAERARLLTQLGACHVAEHDHETALGRYLEALEADEILDAAHEGLIAVLRTLDRPGDTVDALRAWALHAKDDAARADRLRQAAELELTREGCGASAEALLREATTACSEDGASWRLLAEQLWKAERCEETLDVASQGFDTVPDGPDRAALAELRGCALEKQGERSEAAASYRAAARLDTTRSSAALAAARLLRALGEWSSAAGVLRDFANAHRGRGDASGLASALHQLGRLLAGPLEDLEGAIDVYRRALVADPEQPEVNRALAELLAHRPEHWDEALARHRSLIDDDPTRTASLRAVLRIARGRDSQDAVAQGLGILAALGVATPEERHAAPARVRATQEPCFRTPAWELARAIAQAAAREIGEALGVGSPAARETGADDPLSAFRDAVTQAEGRLSAPAIVPLSTDELARCVTLVAEICLESEGVNGDGKLVNALSHQLGRRTRRRVKRIFEGHLLSELRDLDFASWRRELRGLAGVAAIAETGASLRTALCAWLSAGEDGAGCKFSDDADITPLVATNNEARALLRRLALDWIDTL